MEIALSCSGPCDDGAKKREKKRKTWSGYINTSFHCYYLFILFIMSTYKLYYFNGRGRAEVSRLIFAAAGEKYEDIRYERSEWPAHKSEMPLGQAPVLEYNGTKIPQSMAIARFLAKQFHLAGKDNFEQAKVDAVVDTISDVVGKFVQVRFEADESKKRRNDQEILFGGITETFEKSRSFGETLW